MQNRKGFTLIELLIVVVIIGILAAIALPKFGQTRERAYYTTMTADLTNLRSTQEMYYQTTGNFNYAPDMSDLEFSASSGVHLTITGGDSGAWAATATHTALGSGHGCAIFYGEIDNSAVSYPTIPGGGTTIQATQEGRPVCDQ
jgi:prepilin-type N-terminal cleavage/methylation domain-containing protein